MISKALTFFATVELENKNLNDMNAFYLYDLVFPQKDDEEARNNKRLAHVMLSNDKNVFLADEMKLSLLSVKDIVHNDPDKIFFFCVGVAVEEERLCENNSPQFNAKRLVMASDIISELVYAEPGSCDSFNDEV